MASTTISPSIDQGQKQQFESTFFMLAQQTKSKLQQTGALMFLPSDGKTNNFARMGGNYELVEVDARNPNKEYGDYAIDNRFMRKRRFTRTFTVDAKDDVNELIADPTSSLMTQLDYSVKRTMDRIATAAAVGNVLTGAPDTSGTSKTADEDGVITIDATSTGITYEKVLEGIENYINNDLFELAQMGTTLCLTGMENTDVMSEIEFINQDYVRSRPVESGTMDKASMFDVALFAGSKTGGITVTNPILPEASTTRKCLMLAPESIAMSMKLADLSVMRNPNKVNSNDITVDLWIEAMRTEGARVQILTTTF